jgi:serine/threonine protein phosphatase PrpC
VLPRLLGRFLADLQALETISDPAVRQFKARPIHEDFADDLADVLGGPSGRVVFGSALDRRPALVRLAQQSGDRALGELAEAIATYQDLADGLSAATPAHLQRRHSTRVEGFGALGDSAARAMIATVHDLLERFPIPVAGIAVTRRSDEAAPEEQRVSSVAGANVDGHAITSARLEVTVPSRRSPSEEEVRRAAIEGMGKALVIAGRWRAELQAPRALREHFRNTHGDPESADFTAWLRRQFPASCFDGDAFLPNPALARSFADVYRELADLRPASDIPVTEGVRVLYELLVRLAEEVNFSRDRALRTAETDQERADHRAKLEALRQLEVRLGRSLRYQDLLMVEVDLETVLELVDETLRHYEEVGGTDLVEFRVAPDSSPSYAFVTTAPDGVVVTLNERWAINREYLETSHKISVDDGFRSRSRGSAWRANFAHELAHVGQLYSARALVPDSAAPVGSEVLARHQAEEWRKVLPRLVALFVESGRSEDLGRLPAWLRAVLSGYSFKADGTPNFGEAFAEARGAVVHGLYPEQAERILHAHQVKTARAETERRRRRGERPVAGAPDGVSPVAGQRSMPSDEQSAAPEATGAALVETAAAVDATTQSPALAVLLAVVAGRDEQLKAALWATVDRLGSERRRQVLELRLGRSQAPLQPWQIARMLRLDWPQVVEAQRKGAAEVMQALDGIELPPAEAAPPSPGLAMLLEVVEGRDEQAKAALWAAVDGLNSDRQRQILGLRLGRSEEPLMPKEIAARLGLGQRQVSDTQKRAIAAVRAALTSGEQRGSEMPTRNAVLAMLLEVVEGRDERAKAALWAAVDGLNSESQREILGLRLGRSEEPLAVTEIAARLDIRWTQAYFRLKRGVTAVTDAITGGERPRSEVADRSAGLSLLLEVVEGRDERAKAALWAAVDGLNSESQREILGLRLGRSEEPLMPKEIAARLGLGSDQATDMQKRGVALVAEALTGGALPKPDGGERGLARQIVEGAAYGAAGRREKFREAVQRLQNPWQQQVMELRFGPEKQLRPKLIQVAGRWGTSERIVTDVQKRAVRSVAVKLAQQVVEDAVHGSTERQGEFWRTVERLTPEQQRVVRVLYGWEGAPESRITRIAEQLSLPVRRTRSLREEALMELMVMLDPAAVPDGSAMPPEAAVAPAVPRADPASEPSLVGPCASYSVHRTQLELWQARGAVGDPPAPPARPVTEGPLRGDLVAEVGAVLRADVHPEHEQVRSVSALVDRVAGAEGPMVAQAAVHHGDGTGHAFTVAWSAEHKVVVYEMVDGQERIHEGVAAAGAWARGYSESQPVVWFEFVDGQPVHPLDPGERPRNIPAAFTRVRLFGAADRPAEAGDPASPKPGGTDKPPAGGDDTAPGEQGVLRLPDRGLRDQDGIPVSELDEPERAERLTGETESAAAVSKRGSAHDRNEDAVVVVEFTHNGKPVQIAAVFDGVGGAPDGHRAAQEAASELGAYLQERWSSTRFGRKVTRESVLRDALHHVHQRVRELGRLPEYSGHPDKPQCTVAAVIMEADRFTVGWVGDSRIGWTSADGRHAMWWTGDHSSIRMFARENGMSEREALDREPWLENYRHAIEYALGREGRIPAAPGADVTPGEYLCTVRVSDDIDAPVIAEDGTITVPRGGVVLAMTDGAIKTMPGTGVLGDAAARHAGEPRAIAAEVVQRAVDEGETDDVSVIAVGHRSTETRRAGAAAAARHPLKRWWRRVGSRQDGTAPVPTVTGHRRTSDPRATGTARVTPDERPGLEPDEHTSRSAPAALPTRQTETGRVVLSGNGSGTRADCVARASEDYWATLGVAPPVGVPEPGLGGVLLKDMAGVVGAGWDPEITSLQQARDRVARTDRPMIVVVVYEGAEGEAPRWGHAVNVKRAADGSVVVHESGVDETEWSPSAPVAAVLGMRVAEDAQDRVETELPEHARGFEEVRVGLRPGLAALGPETFARVEAAKKELAALPGYWYISDLPMPEPGETFGADWVSKRGEWLSALFDGRFDELRDIELTEKDFLELGRIVERFPVYTTLALIVAAGLSADQLLHIRKMGWGQLFIRQTKITQKEGTTSVWKLRTMRKDNPLEPSSRKNKDKTTPVSRFARDTSLDELPQLLAIAAGTMQYFSGRPLLEQDHERMKNVLTAEEYEFWDGHLKNDLWSALHFPGCREHDPESKTYLRARYLAAFIWSNIGSRAAQEYMMRIVDRYLAGVVVREAPNLPIDTAEDILRGMAGLLPGSSGQQLLDAADRVAGGPFRKIAQTMRGTANRLSNLLYPMPDEPEAAGFERKKMLAAIDFVEGEIAETDGPPPDPGNGTGRTRTEPVADSNAERRPVPNPGQGRAAKGGTAADNATTPWSARQHAASSPAPIEPSAATDPVPSASTVPAPWRKATTRPSGEEAVPGATGSEIATDQGTESSRRPPALESRIDECLDRTAEVITLQARQEDDGRRNDWRKLKERIAARLIDVSGEADPLQSIVDSVKNPENDNHTTVVLVDNGETMHAFAVTAVGDTAIFFDTTIDHHANPDLTAADRELLAQDARVPRVQTEHEFRNRFTEIRRVFKAEFAEDPATGALVDLYQNEPEDPDAPTPREGEITGPPRADEHSRAGDGEPALTDAQADTLRALTDTEDSSGTDREHRLLLLPDPRPEHAGERVVVRRVAATDDADPLASVGDLRHVVPSADDGTRTAAGVRGPRILYEGNDFVVHEQISGNPLTVADLVSEDMSFRGDVAEQLFAQQAPVEERPATPARAEWESGLRRALRRAEAKIAGLHPGSMLGSGTGLLGLPALSDVFVPKPPAAAGEPQVHLRGTVTLADLVAAPDGTLARSGPGRFDLGPPAWAYAAFVVRNPWPPEVRPQVDDWCRQQIQQRHTEAAMIDFERYLAVEARIAAVGRALQAPRNPAAHTVPHTDLLSAFTADVALVRRAAGKKPVPESECQAVLDALADRIARGWPSMRRRYLTPELDEPLPPRLGVSIRQVAENARGEGGAARTLRQQSGAHRLEVTRIDRKEDRFSGGMHLALQAVVMIGQAEFGDVTVSFDVAGNGTVIASVDPGPAADFVAEYLSHRGGAERGSFLDMVRHFVRGAGADVLRIKVADDPASEVLHGQDLLRQAGLEPVENAPQWLSEHCEWVPGVVEPVTPRLDRRLTRDQVLQVMEQVRITSPHESENQCGVWHLPLSAAPGTDSETMVTVRVYLDEAQQLGFDLDALALPAAAASDLFHQAGVRGPRLLYDSESSPTAPDFRTRVTIHEYVPGIEVGQHEGWERTTEDTFRELYRLHSMSTPLLQSEWDRHQQSRMLELERDDVDHRLDRLTGGAPLFVMWMPALAYEDQGRMGFTHGNPIRRKMRRDADGRVGFTDAKLAQYAPIAWDWARYYLVNEWSDDAEREAVATEIRTILHRYGADIAADLVADFDRYMLLEARKSIIGDAYRLPRKIATGFLTVEEALPAFHRNTNLVRRAAGLDPMSEDDVRDLLMEWSLRALTQDVPATPPAEISPAPAAAPRRWIQQLFATAGTPASPEFTDVDAAALRFLQRWDGPRRLEPTRVRFKDSTASVTTVLMDGTRMSDEVVFTFALDGSGRMVAYCAGTHRSLKADGLVLDFVRDAGADRILTLINDWAAAARAGFDWNREHLGEMAAVHEALSEALDELERREPSLPDSIAEVRRQLRSGSVPTPRELFDAGLTDLGVPLEQIAAPWYGCIDVAAAAGNTVWSEPDAPPVRAAPLDPAPPEKLFAKIKREGAGTMDWQVAARQFLRARLRAPDRQGNNKRAWFFRDDNGNRIVVHQVMRAASDEKDLTRNPTASQGDIRWFHRLPFDVPDAVRLAGSVTDVPARVYRWRDFYVEEFAEGRTPAPTDPDWNVVLNKLFQVKRRMLDVPLTPDLQVRPVTEHLHLYLDHQRRNYRGRALWLDRLFQLAPHQAWSPETDDEAWPPSLNHNDMTLENIRIAEADNDDDTTTLVDDATITLIDWDNAAITHRLWDYVTMLWSNWPPEMVDAVEARIRDEVRDLFGSRGEAELERLLTMGCLDSLYADSVTFVDQIAEDPGRADTLIARFHSDYRRLCRLRGWEPEAQEVIRALMLTEVNDLRAERSLSLVDFPVVEPSRPAASATGPRVTLPTAEHPGDPLLAVASALLDQGYSPHGYVVAPTDVRYTDEPGGRRLTVSATVVVDGARGLDELGDLRFQVRVG